MLTLSCREKLHTFLKFSAGIQAFLRLFVFAYIGKTSPDTDPLKQILLPAVSAAAVLI